MPKSVPKKRKYFYAYLTVMDLLKISRRTLQRWIDDMEIKPLEFEDQMRVFLTLPNVDRLTEYAKIMKTRNMNLIQRYRQAVQTDNNYRLARLREELAEFKKKKKPSGDKRKVGPKA